MYIVYILFRINLEARLEGVDKKTEENLDFYLDLYFRYNSKQLK